MGLDADRLLWGRVSRLPTANRAMGRWILILIGIFAANVLTVRTCDGGPARTHSKFTVELLARNRFRIFSATLLLPRPLAEF